MRQQLLSWLREKATVRKRVCGTRFKSPDQAVIDEVECSEEPQIRQKTNRGAKVGARGQVAAGFGLE